MAAGWQMQQLFKSNKLLNPCKDCTKRSATCHADCKEYAEWQEKHIEERREANKERYRETMLKRDEVLRTVGTRRRNKYE